MERVDYLTEPNDKDSTYKKLDRIINNQWVLAGRQQSLANSLASLIPRYTLYAGLLITSIASIKSCCYSRDTLEEVRILRGDKNVINSSVEDFQ